VTFLVDTNVLSEPARREADPRVCAWLDGLSRQEFAISVISWGEILRGVAMLPDGTRRNSLMRWMQVDLSALVGDRILPIDLKVAEAWAHFRADSARRGFSASSPDAFIAATAIVHGHVVATRNTKDFEPFGVPVFNPWAA
jgi:toxin FitB